ncbi:multicopper oxidase domain-containing protein [Microbacterium sp. NC79]|uniref:multicopper oxidase domain-containing protein n=1 Tax=Microbacterium sp. NC79 TaxID=2851009 RepID=UPI00349F0613
MSLLTTRGPGPGDAPGRGFRVMRDIPTVVWIVLAIVAALTHRYIPMPRWLLIHLFLLGAATHAILVWSQYFSYALLRTRATVLERRREDIRLILANGGAALVLFGVPLQLTPVVIVGALALIGAVAWHAGILVRRVRASLPGRFGGTVRYYIFGAALLALGATVGVLVVLGVGGGDPGIGLAHAIINVLGWVGFAVAGTVVTLWPTVLRTKAAEGAARGATRALPLLLIGVVVAAIGASLTSVTVAGTIMLAAGGASYLAGIIVIAVSLVWAARQAPPTSFAAMSMGAAIVWWAGALAAVIIGMIVALAHGDVTTAAHRVVHGAVPYLAAGFVVQVLLGALSYLIPVVLGGGPRAVKAGNEQFDRYAAARVAIVNASLLVYVLPVSSLTLVVVSILYLVAAAAFVPIMFAAMRAQRRAKAEPGTAPRAPRAEPDDSATARIESGKRAGQGVAGLLAVVLAVAVCAAISPVPIASPPSGAAANAQPDAPVQTVQVSAADMRFSPASVEVPVGTRLIVELTNTDDVQVHDLVFANGVTSSRLAPGESKTIDVGIITADVDGWCSIVGHRQMGMTFTVIATGAPAADDAPAPHHPADGSATPTVDLMQPFSDEFTPYPAALSPLPQAAGPVTHQQTLVVRDTEVEVAPGVTQTLWTFADTAPGPTLHGRVGDTFEITLKNDASLGHSIDFHAGALAPNEPMRTIAPGEELTYTFTATKAGIWMYHCSTMPMTAHLANGMYGAVVIEPDDLPAVDRSYVLVQSEYYLGIGEAGTFTGGSVDVDKIAAGTPDIVTFNGAAAQYDAYPLPARVGERVRVWVLDAGIERATSFHVIGGQFDSVWFEGAYLLNQSASTGSQALALAPAQGGFVELEFSEAGSYPFVSHYMVDAERGAHGLFEVTD